MKVSYEYAAPSSCRQQGEEAVLGLSPDLSREERVSFRARMKNPLVFRDAMLMLRQIVLSDMGQKKKERVDFFAWLELEIERRIQQHEKFLPVIRESLENDMKKLLKEREEKDEAIRNLTLLRNEVRKEIDSQDAWRDYYAIERSFWKFIRERDMALWFVLDPVITVHPDQVSFEAFSIDESTYGCLSIDMEEFEMLQQPMLGTTNIDFSAKLAKELERLRTYNKLELSINAEGFQVDSDVMPEHIEKKIDLPETWIKGFNQVSSAASLSGIEIDLLPVDMYDICCFLRRHKAHKSPRYMKWILEPGQPVRILFEPFGKKLILSAVYEGDRKREEKIWGRERWLVMERLIPLAKSFKVRLLGFGLPQFLVADMGTMKMTIGFSSWSSNDWVKGTAFNVIAGYIGQGNYEEVYSLLKEKRFLSMDNITESLKEATKDTNKAGVGMLFRRGEGYYDPVKNIVRFRQLCNTPIPKELYETTKLELELQNHLQESLDNLKIMTSEHKEFIAAMAFKMSNSKFRNWRYHGTEDYNRQFDYTNTEIIIDEDGQISKVTCNCKDFKKGARNISAPCGHILALYIMSSKFSKLNLDKGKEYKIKDIMEILL